MTEQNVTENFEVEAADIAAAAAATEEFTNTIGDAVAAEAEVEVAAPVLHEGPIQTVGRRKRAIVRVRLVEGSGQFICNGRSLEEYFPNKLHQQLIKAPLALIDRDGQFDIHANLTGGGPTGQAGAFRLAIARALNIYNPADRPALKKAGFLTRDARAVERKKAGLHKARRAPQYSKR
ncbi:30S ribosomal protein S9 [Corynebacterium felinum]|uniref:Small ribosomal subunit protein uS9 n=1 Tax=Corynebacterium felinum TaxID=131318 RepID=A0ABU2B7Z5_9CORY|nr:MULTISPECIES: 30S ribosomal protein S9 [Corynebacterium]MDF5820987.1 30S ribosomal protein S9 [Corynebacterium felinum]MDO4760831.1 30S ribosomal protein S9 [Corynebacterium sp.]MDR7354732.1 small subunit ribosomal protein S9 [Corynebacterium felinum]WJY94095.1 30S ribosomal protein S9 [Corynebacterium felinum]